MSRLLILIGIILPLLFSSCGQKQKPLKDRIQKAWEFQSEDGEKSTFYLYSKNSQLHFKSNLSFLPDSTGKWKLLNDSTILLMGSSLGHNNAIDSTVFSTDSTGVPEILFYEGGKEIGAIKGAGKTQDVAHYQSKELVYIQSVKNNQLALRFSNGERYQFKYTPSKIDTGFSLVSVGRGLMGIICLIALAWLFSSNRKAISWPLVLKGILVQIVFALLILKVPFVEMIFESVSSFFVQVIQFTDEGTQFLFKSFDTNKIEKPLLTFVVTVLPTIIFFSALTSLFYYWGILQKIVYAFAWVMRRTLKLSGAESMAAAGNVFLGQTESPLLIKPYLNKMTKSEMMTLMVGGMATIAGGVLASYIGFLGGDDPAEQLYFAKHLLAASVMSAPAAIVAAKILVPESEQYNKKLSIPKDKMGSNALEAITNGTTDGLKLAVNVAAMLLVFIALMAMANYILSDMIGEWTGLNEMVAANTQYDKLSFQFLLGYLVAPIAWILGVSSEDMFLVGELLGQKTILNEFVAYTSFGEMKAAGKFSDNKSVVMATYMLCGFANFASIGIQIGGIGALVPNRKGLLSKLGVKALIGGTLACLFTAAIVGMLL